MLYTPVNNIELIKNKRLVIILWYLDELTNGYQVIGQLNVPLFGFQQIMPEQPPFMSAFEMDLTNSNEVVGSVDFKLVFDSMTTLDK